MTKHDSPEEYVPTNQRAPAHIANESGNEVAERLESLIGHILGSALDEIDYIVAELEKVRNELRNEGERVGRLVVNNVALSKAMMSGMKIISDKIKEWNSPSDQSE
jgi:hypothetical protein